MFAASTVESTIHAITFPAFQIDLSAALFLGLCLLFGVVIFCQARYPVQTSRVFHVPEGVHGVTATKWPPMKPSQR